MSRKNTSIYPIDISMKTERFAPFLEELKHIFEEMDRKYQDIADVYGFACCGCEDSCCRTRFYHHTFLEFFYVSAGVDALEASVRKRIHRRAVNAVRAYAETDKSGDRIRSMCPLNSEGRCLIYAHRPMICRLHGIPHALHHPVEGVVTGPGCHAFDKVSQEREDVRLDRTPFYSSLAFLEKKLRISLNHYEKIRLTVADMMVLIRREQVL